MMDDQINSEAYRNALQSMIDMGGQHGQQQDLSAATPQEAGMADQHPANTPQAPQLQGQQMAQAPGANTGSTVQAPQPTAKDASVGNPYFYAAPEDDQQKKQGGGSSMMSFLPMLAALA